jgi:hypothetical protein
MNGTLVLFDFNKDSDLSSWYILDDRVMGGVSQGTFFLNDQGHAIFKGDVSTDNNGGFSSVRFDAPFTNVENYSFIVLRVKGDQKPYQLRVKSNKDDWYSYITNFETNGEWETIEIPMSEMYPSYRGRSLDMPNYEGISIDELSFLIGNKKAESFQLEIDWIVVK